MTENIDAHLKPLLQKEVVFSFKHKNYKRGRLLIYKLSGNYLSFTIINEKKRETFEVPFPYTVDCTNSAVVFSYTLESLAEKDFALLLALKSVNKIKNCKFYDNILYIKSL